MMTRGLTLILGGGLVLLMTGPAGALEWDFQSTTTGDLPLPNNGSQQTACLVGDLDGDGVDDFIIAERKAAPSVLAYFLRPTGWEREIIDADIRTVEAGGLLFDLDDDGDLDLLLGGDNSTNEIWWWENPGEVPYLTGWTRRLVKNTGSAHHHDQVIGDFDGDGALEMAFWNQYAGNRLQLAEIPTDPRATEPWPWTEIYQAAGPAEGLDKADINLDGKIDIVGAGYWFEHVTGTTYTPHLIASDRLYTRTAVAQLVPGGRPEIVTSPGDAVGSLVWYQWVDEAWQANELDPLVLHGHSLSLGDVDNNGMLDFLVAEMHTPGGGDQARMRIFLNQGGGIFTPETVNVGLGNHESKLGDFNDDGLLDLVGKPFKEGSPQINIWLQVPEVVAPPDTLAAEIRWIRATDPGQMVTVQFSEAVTPASAEDPVHYSINGGVTVLTAVLSPDGRTVNLGVAGMDPGMSYSLVTQDVADLADPGNLTEGTAQTLFQHRPWGRSATGLVALYDFEQSGGDVVFDVKPSGHSVDLSIPDTSSVIWTDGGLDLPIGSTIVSQDPVLELTAACAASGEISLEAWVQTAALDQNGPARLLTVSANAQNRNFTLGQGVPGGATDQFSVRMRTSTTDQNGQPTAGSGAGSLGSDLTHCVVTRDGVGILKIYVDGVLKESGPRSGDLSNWNTGYHLALGGELDATTPRHWLGELKLVAVYSRALDAGEITQHFLAGADAPQAVVAAVPSSSGGFLTVTPNPFNARVALRLASDRRQEVDVAVFDLRGRHVATLADGAIIDNRETTFTWDGTAESGTPSASGTYFFRARGDRWTEVVKVTLAK